MISSTLTVVLGAARLPHVTMRMYTASNARQVRWSMSWAVPCVALFVLIITVTVIGFGATAVVGRAAIAGAVPQGHTAYLLGSRAVFGADVSTGETFLFTMVTTALFETAQEQRRQYEAVEELIPAGAVRRGSQPLPVTTRPGAWQRPPGPLPGPSSSGARSPGGACARLTGVGAP